MLAAAFLFYNYQTIKKFAVPPPPRFLNNYISVIQFFKFSTSFPGIMWGPVKDLGLIGSAVLTIMHRINKQAKYIYSVWVYILCIYVSISILCVDNHYKWYCKCNRSIFSVAISHTVITRKLWNRKKTFRLNVRL